MYFCRVVGNGGLWFKGFSICLRCLVIRSSTVHCVVILTVRYHGTISHLLGKSDPYCEVSMGAQEHKTKVISSTLNPKWNASMQFTVRDIDMDALCITVFDRDLFSPNGIMFME